ncbi:fumarylacetoacetate hydrolase family protein [Lysinimonas soli]|uniref:Fumarylacetoacetate hydrolase family protein n=1 Tax=Lysinimonas soli TaxID=1074233 RepID=A0ABW0NSA2_9MICO
MKLVTYGPPGGELPGVVEEGGSVVALAPALSRAGIRILDMGQLLAVWSAVRPVVELAVEDPQSERIPADSVRLGPPVPRPGKILAIGLNYPTHTGDSLGATTSESQPVVFMKTPNSLSGPSDTVILPRQSTQVDYELELAVVIGKAGSHIARADAFDHVAGYMISNDVSARDVAFGPGLEYPMQLQIVRGKGFPTFCPTGPWLVTADEVPEPGRLKLQLWVNDELRQDGNTSEMSVDIPGLIESISSSMPLLPGDIVLTGTPAGCGFLFDPPRYLADGDMVKAAVPGLGEMAFEVRDE